MNLGELQTEQRNPASVEIDSLPTAEILAIITTEDAKVAPAVASQIPQIAQTVEGIVERIGKGGRLFYIGAGTRSTETSEDDPESGKRDLESRGFTGRDTLIGIAASGRTPYVLGAVDHARRLGAMTVGISCTHPSDLGSIVDIAITPLTGPEVIAGSTRMKAGTATKLVLNMISTAVMIRLGHVYGNLMVNVEPRNSKLRDRARRIVAEAASVSDERAAGLLEEAGGKVKIAIVMARLSLGRDTAESMLAAAGGSISKVLRKAEKK